MASITVEQEHCLPRPSSIKTLGMGRTVSFSSLLRASAITLKKSLSSVNTSQIFLMRVRLEVWCVPLPTPAFAALFVSWVIVSKL